MALYGAILGPVVPDAIGHIFISSIVSTPAAITVAALMVPGRMTREDAVQIARQDASAMDAITRGTAEGVAFVIQIVAMLIVLIALVLRRQRDPGPAARLSGSAALAAAHLRLVLRAARLVRGIPWAESQAAGASSAPRRC
jgi:CNT family concentrative nucleoside transporter